MRVVVDGVIFGEKGKGGIARLFRETLSLICEAEEDIRITLFCEGSENPSDLPTHPRISKQVIPFAGRWLRPGRLWAPFLATIQKAVRRVALGDGTSQIWHSTYYSLPLAWKGATVVTVYDLIHERFAADLFTSPADDEFRSRKRACIVAADALICISEATRADLLEFYDVSDERIHVVPLACSTAFHVTEPDDSMRSTSADRPYLLYVGDRRAHKDFDVLLRAFADWSRESEVDLVAVGGGPWSHDELTEIRELDVGERVRLIVNATDADLRKIYGRALGFIYPSRYEGFGIPVLEALACGCPLVASRIPSTVEIAGECAIYFVAGDEKSLQKALTRLTSMEVSVDLRNAGIERARRYSWAETSRKIGQVYRALDNR